MGEWYIYTYTCTYVCVCVCDSLFIHLAINGCLNLSVYILVTNDAMNIGVQISFESVFLFPLDTVLKVELLDHMAVQFLIFWETSILFSIMAVPIYIPINSVQGFPFLHSQASSCYLLSFW